nr:hypothetical protein CFP56_46229 [Quercus suber]
MSRLGKVRKVGSDEFEVWKDDSSNAWQTLATSNSIDIEAEQVGPSTLPSHTNFDNLDLNSRQDGTSDTQPAENLDLRDKVRPFSLEPSLVEHARDLHYTVGLGKEVWGLPFESMSEEVGRDLGNSLGKYIELFKRSWLSKLGKVRKVGSDEFEVWKDDSSNARQTLATSNSIDIEAEQVGPSTLPSHTNFENLDLNSRQDGTSDTQPAENLDLRDKVRPFSLEPSLVEHARDLHYTGGLGKEPEDKGKSKEVQPLTKAKDTEDALMIKDAVSKSKATESKSKADPKKDPPRPEDKGKSKEVQPLTKAKDTEDALMIKDAVSKSKATESKSKADPKKDPPRVKAYL